MSNKAGVLNDLILLLFRFVSNMDLIINTRVQRMNICLNISLTVSIKTFTIYKERKCLRCKERTTL